MLNLPCPILPYSACQVKPVELLHFVCICASSLARGTFLRTQRQWSCYIWYVSARALWRAAPSCDRENRGVVAFCMYLREFFGARRLLAIVKAVELLHFVCICASILARGAFLRSLRPWSCYIWCVSARVFWRAATSCDRDARGVVAFSVYLCEYLGARRLPAIMMAVELLDTRKDCKKTSKSGSRCGNTMKELKLFVNGPLTLGTKRSL